MSASDPGELYRQLHDFQLRWKADINARMTLPAGIAALLVGAVDYLLTDFLSMSAKGPVWLLLLCVLFFTVGVGCLTAAVWQLARSLWYHEYANVPMPFEIEPYRRNLIAYYRGNPDVSPGLEAEFRNFLIESYC